MFNLITRFHLLQLLVLLAITGVAFFRVPADFAFPAHWGSAGADWIWPRNLALPVAPAIALILLAGFATLGHLLTKNHLAKVRHILEPALTLLLAILVAVQLGLLLTGIGSDLDLIRLTAFALGATLVVLGIVFAEAERHTYAGLRLPWPIVGDAAWRAIHRITGLAFGLCGAGLLALAWFDPEVGPLVIALAVTLALPTVIAALATLAFRLAGVGTAR
jgi:immunity protein, SdpI family